MNLSKNMGNKRPSFLRRYQVQLPAAIAALSEPATLLDSFQPSELDVICGRGKGCYDQAGNIRMRDICKANISKYLAAKTKLDKSLVISDIVEQVQNNGTARFVKLDKDLGWVVISDEKAREKVGHALREALTAEYRHRQPKPKTGTEHRETRRCPTLDDFSLTF
jgi:hypothetical protein